MDRQYLFLNVGLCFWLIALIASFFSFFWSGIFFILALAAFFVYALQQEVFSMFKKQNKPTEAGTNNAITVPAVSAEKPLQQEEQLNNTVISRETCFEGNITATGKVYIYGEVQGNITAKEGMVKVMKNGLVNGDITSHEMIIDGTVNGECKAESIDICEHATVNGALDYVTLSVKKGAAFTGQAQTARKPENNVIGLASTPATLAAKTSAPAEKAEAPPLSKKRS
jgi:cytoskeletal protein CcmA (bactofilin family)